MATQQTTTTTAVPAAAAYTTGTTYTTAADVAGRSSTYGGGDGLSLLAQRLQALTDDGVKSEWAGRSGWRASKAARLQLPAGGRPPPRRMQRCFLPAYSSPGSDGSARSIAPIVPS